MFEGSRVLGTPYIGFNDAGTEGEFGLLTTELSDSRVYIQALQPPESIEVHADSDSSVLVDSYPNVPVLNDAIDHRECSNSQCLLALDGLTIPINSFIGHIDESTQRSIKLGMSPECRSVDAANLEQDPRPHFACRNPLKMPQNETRLLAIFCGVNLGADDLRQVGPIAVVDRIRRGVAGLRNRLDFE